MGQWWVIFGHFYLNHLSPLWGYFWKLNDTLFDNEEFVKGMSDLISGIRRVYGFLEPIELWELLKSECCKFARKFSRDKSNQEKKEIQNLYKILDELQKKLAEGGPEEIIKVSKELVERDIDSYETRDARRAAFRCHANWYQFGKVPSKFFFNREKRNFTSKTMYIARKPDGTLTKDYKEILNLQYLYYGQLYMGDPRVRFTMNNVSGIQLDAIQKQQYDSDLSVEELFDAMMMLKAGKCPGADGLSLLFYRTFWKQLSGPLFACLCAAVDNKKFNPSARRYCEFDTKKR